SHFYEYAGESMKKYFKHVRLWKYVGDEVLFFLKITDKQTLYNLCEYVFKVQNSLTKSIHENFSDSKGILFVKSTVWSAVVETIKSGNIENFMEEEFAMDTNLIFFYSHANGINIDFLGPDIDVGFRISN